jgi:hypothetical protein
MGILSGHALTINIILYDLSRQRGDQQEMMSASGFSNWRALFVTGTPLFLAALELRHPTGDGKTTPFEGILPQVDWWLLLHLLQVPLFGLMGLAVMLLVSKLKGLAVSVSRVGIGFFLVFYTALDAITGIASGMLIRGARSQPPALQEYVSSQVNQLFFDPLVGGTTLSLFAVLGAGGWLIGVMAAAVALDRAGVDRFTTVLLGISGVLFAMSHTPPTGPLGLFLFFLAAVRIPRSVFIEDTGLSLPSE